MKPPTCRTCGKAEWRHRCLGAVPVQKRIAKIEKQSVKLGSKGKAITEARGAPKK